MFSLENDTRKNPNEYIEEIVSLIENKELQMDDNYNKNVIIKLLDSLVTPEQFNQIALDQIFDRIGQPEVPKQYNLRNFFNKYFELYEDFKESKTIYAKENENIKNQKGKEKKLKLTALINVKEENSKPNCNIYLQIGEKTFKDNSMKMVKNSRCEIFLEEPIEGNIIVYTNDINVASFPIDTLRNDTYDTKPIYLTPSISICDPDFEISFSLKCLGETESQIEENNKNIAILNMLISELEKPFKTKISSSAKVNQEITDGFIQKEIYLHQHSNRLERAIVRITPVDITRKKRTLYLNYCLLPFICINSIQRYDILTVLEFFGIMGIIYDKILPRQIYYFFYGLILDIVMCFLYQCYYLFKFGAELPYEGDSSFARKMVTILGWIELLVLIGLLFCLWKFEIEKRVNGILRKIKKNQIEEPKILEVLPPTTERKKKFRPNYVNHDKINEDLLRYPSEEDEN